MKSGIDHIDTSDFYGPHVTNQLIREALHPYPDDLVLVTKVGAVRGADASWNPAQSPAELTRAVHDNLRNLGLDVLEVVNLRVMGAVHEPSEGSIEEQFTALAKLREQGLIRHLGLSNATAAQVAEGQTIAPVVCVQNQYNLAIARTTHWSTIWRRKASPMCRSSRSAASRRCNRPRCRTWLRAEQDADAGGAGLAAASRAEHPANSGYLVDRASE